MKPVHYEEIKIAAVRFREEGNKLVTGMFGARSNCYWPSGRTWESDNLLEGQPCACAIGAFVIVTQPPAASSALVAFAKHIGANVVEIHAFVDGMDGNAVDHTNRPYPEWYKAGARMREELGLE